MPTIPNRSEDLTPAGERKRKSRGTTVTKGEARESTVPDPNPEWCEVAYGLWEAAQTSGQADFYQNTDWWTLYFACDQITYLYEQGRRSPEFLKGILAMLTGLMFTEADRRKAHIELTERADEAEDAAVLALATYKATLGVEDA
jgi:hypothetical protein